MYHLHASYFKSDNCAASPWQSVYEPLIARITTKMRETRILQFFYKEFHTNASGQLLCSMVTNGNISGEITISYKVVLHRERSSNETTTGRRVISPHREELDRHQVKPVVPLYNLDMVD
uniref:Uncharacterized protein n=1 Tax=Angiostrongylus cantonensis TaxID=6313 RepID=A0A0K0D9K6_ANGCA